MYEAHQLNSATPPSREQNAAAWLGGWFTRWAPGRSVSPTPRKRRSSGRDGDIALPLLAEHSRSSTPLREVSIWQGPDSSDASGFAAGPSVLHRSSSSSNSSSGNTLDHFTQNLGNRSRSGSSSSAAFLFGSKGRKDFGLQLHSSSSSSSKTTSGRASEQPWPEIPRHVDWLRCLANRIELQLDSTGTWHRAALTTAMLPMAISTVCTLLATAAAVSTLAMVAVPNGRASRATFETDLLACHAENTAVGCALPRAGILWRGEKLAEGPSPVLVHTQTSFGVFRCSVAHHLEVAAHANPAAGTETTTASQKQMDRPRLPPPA